MTKLAKGHCLCKAVRFEFTGDPAHTFHCHCDSCRRAVSSALTTWVTVSKNKFRFSKDIPAYFESSPGVKRGFCGACGSPLTYEGPRHPDDIDLYAASLEAGTAVAPTFHVYADEQVPWCEVHDQLPRYGGSIVSDEPPIRIGSIRP